MVPLRRRLALSALPATLFRCNRLLLAVLLPPPAPAVSLPRPYYSCCFVAARAACCFVAASTAAFLLDGCRNYAIACKRVKRRSTIVVVALPPSCAFTNCWPELANEKVNAAAIKRNPIPAIAIVLERFFPSLLFVFGVIIKV